MPSSELGRSREFEKKNVFIWILVVLKQRLSVIRLNKCSSTSYLTLPAAMLSKVIFSIRPCFSWKPPMYQLIIYAEILD